MILLVVAVVHWSAATVVAREGEARELLGTSLAGWEFLDVDEPIATAEAWTLEEGVLRADGDPAGWLSPPGEFGDFVLEFEWRWEPGTDGGNSGLLIHAIPDQPGHNQWPLCLEVQLRVGDAGNFWIIGENMGFHAWNPIQKPRGLPLTRVMRDPRTVERPPGQWNHMRVVSDGGTVTVHVNGWLANRLTHVAPRRGRIGWQSEGAPIQFRAIRLTE